MASALLIDVSKCTGCRACQVACKQWNDLPGEETVCTGSYENPPDLSPTTWNRVVFREFERNGQTAWVFQSRRCLHCLEASCVSVCPTGAAAHHMVPGHGHLVKIDPTWCIGCGYCQQACPFGIPRLGHEPKGVARKCTFCADRVSNGLEPACAKTCPSGALLYGERDELITRAEARVQQLQARGYTSATLYGVDQLGGLGVMYVLTDQAPMFGLPETPRLASRTLVGQWLSGLITAGVVAVLPFWLLFRRREEMAARRADEGGEEQ